jgi:hypothetical protein
MPTRTVSVIDELLAQYAPELQRAFFEAVSSITDNVRMSAFEAAIAAGDIEAALRVIGLDLLAFEPVRVTLIQAFQAAGMHAAAALPVVRALSGANVVVRFNVRNPSAERLIEEQAGALITEIVADQRETIKLTLQESLASGTGPRTAALDVVGRISAQTGRREGGTIGLTSAQSRYVANAKAELLSGDYENYFDRALRDKRFDPVVRAAIREGRPLSMAEVSKIGARYSDRMLKYRGEVIARTEMLAALHKGAHAAMEQAIASGAVREQDVVKVWRTAADARVRDSHVALNGQKKAFNELFISPLTGARMAYPHDSTHGARGADTIQCRCRAEYVTNFFAAIVERERLTA